MKSDTKNSARRSRLLIIFGFLFFVNPCPGGLDLIPDAIGCLLIIFGLTMPAYFDSSIEEARKYTVWLLAVESVKLLLMKSVFLTEIGSNRLLAATAFSVLEGILGILIYKKLFSGISYYSMRHGCDRAVEKCDGAAFLSYFALFTRIAATIIPELLAIPELNIEVEVDPDKVDTLTDFISIKPVLTVLLSLIALGIGIAWFISLCRLFGAFFGEAGEEMSTKYTEEYTSKPEETRVKTIFRGSMAMKISLVFALDIAFDGVRILPVCAMFAGIFLSLFFYRGIGDFGKTQRFAVPAVVSFAISEIFARIYVPNGAIVIYETELWIIAVNAVIAVTASGFGLLCIYSLLDSASELSVRLGGGALPTGTPRFMYAASLIFWAAGYIVPYFHQYTGAVRFIFAAVFMLKCGRLFSIIYEEEAYRASFRPKSNP